MIVVTGGCGFIGSILVPELREQGHDVLVLDRAAPAPGTVGHLVTELSDPDEAASRALAEADAVVHLAGCPGVRDRSPDIARRRWRDNVEATAAVLELVPPEVPVLAFSSSSVYGGAPPRPDGTVRASRETDVPSPRGGYARSKVAAERLCADRGSAGGAVLVVRPFTVLGEGQRADMALSRWAAQARQGAPLTLFGSPGRTRDVTDVRDVARATAALLQRGAQGVVNLGTGRPRTLAEIAGTVARVVAGSAELEVTAAAEVEPGHTRADVRRLTGLLGWTPRTDLDDVVTRAVGAPAVRPVVLGAGPEAVLAGPAGPER